jgi:DNA primase
MQTIIEKIKLQLTILELLNYLGIQTNSSGFILSIYKQETKPSLKIYPDTNSYFDFSANTGGDLIKFYKDYFKLDTNQAITKLASVCGIDKTSNKQLKPAKPALQTKANSCLNLQILESEKYFYHERAGIYEYEAKINRNESERLAYFDLMRERVKIQKNVYAALENYCGIDFEFLKYLTGEKRNLNIETIKKSRLFSIKDTHNTISYLKASFNKDDLIISGLFKNDYFIFTNHRLIIPYIEAGEIVYLRGRYFDMNNNTVPPERIGKYIGPYNFATNLTAKRFYNIDALKNKFDKRLIIAEGEFDCLISEQSGAKAIGIPGVSNFPKDKINLLNDKDIYLAFDNDEPGRKAIREIAPLFNRPVKLIKPKYHKDLSEALK